ncbi:S26 family signal peptidase [Halorubrum luteum]
MFDRRLQCSFGVGRASQQGNRFTFRVVPTPSQFGDDPSVRLQRHDTGNVGRSQNGCGTGPGSLSVEPANSLTMDPDDRPQSADDDAAERPTGSVDSDREAADSDDGRDHESADGDEVGSDGELTEGDGDPDPPVEEPGLSNDDSEPIEEYDGSFNSAPSSGDRDPFGEPPNRVESGEDPGFLYRFRHDNDGPLMWIREMLFSVAVVLLLGVVLFAVSGAWPPMVAVESGSMEPNMEVGDLVFVTEPGRFAPDAADNEIGVVTSEVGQETDYRSFGSHGSVIIFQPPDRTASPIIHRAMFHVEAGENWYDRADDRYHRADDCEELRHCPAPHDGYITLGDNNGEYDQANGLAEPVKADWVTGVARVRVPYLGYVRLLATGQVELTDLLSTSTDISSAAVDGEQVRIGPENPSWSGTNVIPA